MLLDSRISDPYTQGYQYTYMNCSHIAFYLVWLTVGLTHLVGATSTACVNKRLSVEVTQLRVAA